MRKYKIILLCCIVLAIAGTSVYFLYNSNRVASFKWEGKAAYQISSHSVINTGDEKIDASITAKGYFKTAPNGVDGEYSIVYAALKNFKLQSSYGYERPKDVAAIDNSIIMIKFAKDGSIADIILSPEITKETADAVKNLLYAAEIILPRDGVSRSSWESMSVNGTETSLLSFTREKSRVIGKKRTSVNAPDIKTSIVSSQYTAKISKTFWLESISGLEILKISTPLGTVLNVSNDILYQSIPFDDSVLTAAFDKSPAELNAQYAKLKGKVFDELRNETTSEEETLIAKPQTLNTEEFVRIFSMLNDNSNDSYFGMVDFLAANPHYFKIIPDIIKSMAKDNDNAARMMIGILEYIGTPVAQGTLTNILADVEQTELSRVRAAVALNGVKKPTDAAIDALKMQITIRGDEVNNMVSNTSYLALGSAASKLMDGGSEKYSEIRTQILSDLSSNGDVPKHIIIEGAGNTSDVELYDNVAGYFTSQESENRLAAVSAAGRLDADRFSTEAGKFIATENDVTVRTGAYKALMGNTSNSTIKLMTENIKKETGAARSPIMKYLTSNVSNPEVSKTLQELTANGELSSTERITVRKAFRSERGIKK